MARHGRVGRISGAKRRVIRQHCWRGPVGVSDYAQALIRPTHAPTMEKAADLYKIQRLSGIGCGDRNPDQSRQAIDLKAFAPECGLFWCAFKCNTKPDSALIGSAKQTANVACPFFRASNSRPRRSCGAGGVNIIAAKYREIDPRRLLRI